MVYISGFIFIYLKSQGRQKTSTACPLFVGWAKPPVFQDLSYASAIVPLYFQTFEPQQKGALSHKSEADDSFCRFVWVRLTHTTVQLWSAERGLCAGAAEEEEEVLGGRTNKESAPAPPGLSACSELSQHRIGSLAFTSPPSPPFFLSQALIRTSPLQLSNTARRKEGRDERKGPFWTNGKLPRMANVAVLQKDHLDTRRK